MLQLTDGAIIEQNYHPNTLTAKVGNVSVGSAVYGNTSNCIVDYFTHPVYWNSYPVYVCTDKTKKAIEVLKTLQAEKLLKCESVPRFIALVEKISAIL